MAGKIFRGIFLVSLFTIIVSMVFIIGVQYQFYDEAQQSQLEAKAHYIADAIETYSYDYLDSLSDTEDRITLIDTDGTVLYDNTTAADKMENHIDRKEVAEAIKTGEGMDVRNSDTLSYSTCYFALRLSDGKIIRVADRNVGLFAIILQLLPAISAVILITVVIALVLSTLIAQRIVRPINNIDLESPVVEESYEELSPLVAKINAQNRKINRQIKKLTRSQREFEIIANNMSEGLILTDRDGNILICNKSVPEVFGISDAQEILNKNIRVLNRDMEFIRLADALDCGKHSAITLSLNEGIYEILANPTVDDSGKHFGNVIIIVDISEKENREKLRQEFTANVSHELKTPLTSIYGISDMLKSGIVRAEDVSGFAEDINRESARLITLVEDIIRLSRLDEGAIPDMNDEVDLLTAARDVAGRLSPLAQKRNITVKADGDTALVRGSATMLDELIRNLCENAVKYNVEGGKVTLTAGVQDGQPFICVEDTGIGIPPEDTDRVFERFYRVDKSHSRQSGGTGLGLSIVKHIAACHNAEITLQSAVNKGTKITVRFKT